VWDCLVRDRLETMRLGLVEDSQGKVDGASSTMDGNIGCDSGPEVILDRRVRRMCKRSTIDCCSEDRRLGSRKADWREVTLLGMLLLMKDHDNLDIIVNGTETVRG
jgi:hypothetical protein